VVAVHLFGQRAPTARLRELCDRHGIPLIEDCAHRVDLLDDRPPLGDMACYSFNAVKEAPAGEGGLVWSSVAGGDERVRILSNLGLTIDTVQRTQVLNHRDYGFSHEIGLKLRGNDLSAALALLSLDHLHALREQRARIFSHYDQAVAAMNTCVQPIERNTGDSFLMYVVRVPAESRDAIREGMAHCGVATSVHYPSLTRHPRLRGPCCPVAERLDRELLTLPSFLALTPSEQDRVLSALAEACQASGAER